MAEPRLLESALRRWWVVLIAFTFTTVLTLIWVTPKPATYESSGTYVVQPRSQVPDDSVKALDTQIRGTQINATYALIARSDEIKDSAVSRLVRVPAHGHLRVEAEAIPGTNALKISAQARQAKSAHALAVAAGAETIAYVDNLQQPYTLELLDPPKLPSHPVNSRKPLTIVLGALLGLFLGLGLAAILDRIVLLRRARRSSTIPPTEQRGLEGAPAQPAVLAPPFAASITAAPADASVDLVADAISEPSVQRDLTRVAGGNATYSLGVVKLEAANGGCQRQRKWQRQRVRRQPRRERGDRPAPARPAPGPRTDADVPSRRPVRGGAPGYERRQGEQAPERLAGRRVRPRR